MLTKSLHCSEIEISVLFCADNAVAVKNANGPAQMFLSFQRRRGGRGGERGREKDREGEKDKVHDIGYVVCGDDLRFFYL